MSINGFSQTNFQTMMRWRHLEKVRWGDGPVCATCGDGGPTMACGRTHYHQCKACNAKFTAAFGRPLKGQWFTALYLLAVSSKGLCGVALGRHLGVGRRHGFSASASAR
jgi:hypothetical protein